MKKLLLLLAVAVLVGGAYLLGSANASKVIAVPEAAWTQGSAAAQAWREYTVSLEAAGARVFERTDRTNERLEGLQYLAQMAAASLEMKLAKGSAVEPQFTDWMADYRKFLGDSPDAIYHTAELSSEYRYEIRGNRGDAGYLGFMLYGRQLNGWNRAAGNLALGDMRIAPDGDFRIVLSRTRPSDPDVDWLPLEDDIHMVMVRQYYHGRDGKQTARFNITNLDAPAYRPPGDAQVAAGLRAAALFFNDTVDGAIALTQMLQGGPNSIDPPASYSNDFGGVFYPTNDNEYYGGWFLLADDEALVIEGAVPDAPYWSVSLQNLWMQSLDYGHYQVGLNDREIETENGRYTVVIAHRQPPSGNWLDTAGHREGMVAIRYQQSQDSEKPSLRLVKFAELD